jgi:soluble lytic murein transglycosylase
MKNLSKFVFSFVVFFNGVSARGIDTEKKALQYWKKVELTSLKKIDSLSAPVSYALVQWLLLRNGELSSEESISFMMENNDFPVGSKRQIDIEKRINKNIEFEKLLSFFKLYPPISAEGVAALLRFFPKQDELSNEVRSILKKWFISVDLETNQKSFLRDYKEYLEPEDFYNRAESLLWEEKRSQVYGLLHYIPEEKADFFKVWMSVLSDKKNTVSSKFEKHPGIAVALSKHLRKTNPKKSARLLQSVDVSLVNTISSKFAAESLAVVRELLDDNFYSDALSLLTFVLAIKDLSEQSIKELHWYSGFILAQYKKEYTLAIEHFKKALENTKDSFETAQYLFWIGYCYSQQKDAAYREWYEKASQYPQTYYGQIACDKLKKTIEFSSISIKDSEYTSFCERPLPLAIKLLSQNKYHKPKSVLLEALSRTLPLEEQALGLKLAMETSIPYFVFYYYEEANHHCNFSVMDSWSKVGFKGKRLKDTDILQAILYNESRFHPHQKDSMGAVGFMQIMPGTLKHIIKKHKFKPLTSVGLGEQPLRSLELGDAYIQELFEKFKESIMLTAVAYNAGPSKLSSFLKTHEFPKNNQDFIWIESFHIPITQKHVKRILATHRIYKELGSKIKIRTIEQFVKDMKGYHDSK